MDARNDLERVRQEASGRLDEAWRRGHMSAAEHERRTTALKHADHHDQVDAIERGEFDAAHRNAHGGVSPIPSVDDEGDAGSAAASRPEAAGTGAGSPAPVRESGRSSVLSPEVGRVIMGVVPLVAVLAFFLTNDSMDNAWLWFLLIPLVWTVVPALGGGKRGGC